MSSFHGRKSLEASRVYGSDEREGDGYQILKILLLFNKGVVQPTSMAYVKMYVRKRSNYVDYDSTSSGLFSQ
jgi:hypothetical protein